MRVAHVGSWTQGGRWVGWEVVDRHGVVVAHVPRSKGTDQTHSYNVAEAFADDLNAAGARRERRLREASTGQGAHA